MSSTVPEANSPPGGARVAVDFGTSNTVIARLDPESDTVQTLEVPGISKAVRYRLRPDDSLQTIHLVPSLIHFGENETLIGQQVVARGLVESKHTFRWIKRSISMGVTKRKRTPQGHKTPADGGAEFLRLLLSYISNEVSLTNDEFTFTSPVEAFEDFQDWLQRVIDDLEIRRVRRIDEATACILGVQTAVSRDDRFLVFDFGCGTLDVSAVRIDLDTAKDRKAVQLGQAGYDIGGMDIDAWIFEDFCARHELDAKTRRQTKSTLLVEAERVKIRLSRADVDVAELKLAADPTADRTEFVTPYTRSCDACRSGESQSQPDNSTGCLGCLVHSRQFLRHVRNTIDRALENAAIKAGMRRDDITRVVVTGGTSLVPLVRRHLKEMFPERVAFKNPFDAVVRGGCRGIVVPLLSHDYTIESFSAHNREFEFKSLLKTGTEYPTPRDCVRFWAKGSYDGMTRIGIKIFEVSRMERRGLEVALVDDAGSLQETSRVATKYHYICLNRDNPTFIVADPPIQLQRDAKRFACSFWVDGNRRLCVTVEDRLARRELMRDHPVVRL